MTEIEPVLGPRDDDVAAYLADGDEEWFKSLMACFVTAAQPFNRGLDPTSLSEAYTMASYWYAESKDRVRRAERGNGQYKDAKLAEDYLEALCKGLEKALMVAMSLARIDRVR